MSADVHPSAIVHPGGSVRDAESIAIADTYNITMVTTARGPEQGRELLKQFGMPFRGANEGKQ